jgi:hypothetical protein
MTQKQQCPGDIDGNCGEWFVGPASNPDGLCEKCLRKKNECEIREVLDSLDRKSSHRQMFFAQVDGEFLHLYKR